MKKLRIASIRVALAGASLLAGYFATTTAWADYSSTVLAQNPEEYLRFSETAPVVFVSPAAVNIGSLGPLRQGTYNGDLAGRGATGVIAGDTAAHFDGVSEFITMPGIAAINTFSNWSVETWYAPDNWNPPGGLTCILSSGNFASPRSGWLIYQQPTGFSVRFYNGNGTAFSMNMQPVVTNTPGTFIHLVLTFDGATAKFYTNGVLCASGSPSGSPNYTPTVDGPFSIGARSDTGFPNAGTQDEVAYYGTLLSPSQVAAHYAAVTTNNAGYSAQILADNPLLYFRLDETPLLTTANQGTYATDFSYGDGTLIYPVVTDVAGPSSPTFPGFEASNPSISVSGSASSQGTGGYVNVPSLQYGTNTVTITGWVKPNGSQASLAGAVMFRSALSAPDTGTSAGLIFDKAGGLNLSYNWDGDDATYNWSSGQGIADGQWNFVSLIVSSNQAIIWAPGSNPDPSTNVHTHASLDFNSETFLGTDPATSGLNGGLDEVAIFGRSLSVGEVYTEYATAVGGLAPRIFSNPMAPTNTLYAGDPLTLSVDAGGTAPITYQWRKNGGAITGATNASYTISSLVAGGPNTYDVVITGTSTVNSTGTSVTVSPAVTPIITQDIAITSRAIYPGGDINLGVTAVGGGLGYQWQWYGTNLVGQTGASLNVPGIDVSNAGPYRVVISNSVNSVSSLVATISVPSPATGTYEAAITADGPISWWRLDDAPGSTNMLDSMGRFDGTWNGTVTLGAAGALTNDANKAVSLDAGSDSWGEIGALPPPAGAGEFTYEVWVRPTDALATESVPFSTFRTQYGFYFDKNTDGTWRGHDGYGDLDGANVSRQALIGNVTLSKWTHLVAVFSAATGHRVYINGQWDGNSYLGFCPNLNIPMRIGALDPNNDYGLRKFFTGGIDEVAVYGYALSGDQILNHYLAGLYSTNNAPIFTIQPQSQTVAQGQNVTFSTLIEGSPTIGQLWFRNGTPIVVGQEITTNVPPVTNLIYATSTSLTLSNVSYADAIGKTYQCVATNGTGSATSIVATLTVTPNPAFANLTNQLVLHLTFDTDYTDSSGRGHNATPVGSPAIVPGVVGPGALMYSTTVDGLGGHLGNVTSANFLTLGAFPPDALSSAPANDLSFSNAVNFSVAYWVRTPTNTGSGDLPFLCSAINSYQNFGMTFAPTYDTSTLGGWSWSLGDGTTFAGLYGPAGSIDDGSWHHLVHTFNWTTGEGITYLDGAFVSTVGISVLGDIDSGNPFSIGQDPTGMYPEAATNYLDDLAVWKGRVLTPSEAYSAYYVGKTFGNSFTVIAPITIQTTTVSGSHYIVWQTGTLNWADNVQGPYTPVPGAVAPYYQINPTLPKKFFRVQ